MKKACIIATLLYLFFFSDILKSKYFFWSSDAAVKHYPARVFLYKSIVNEHKFPFWTERVFLGYAPYDDMELGYLNPVNLISVIFLGPVWAYKFLHFLSYLIGCCGFYYLIKKKGYSLISYTAGIATFYFSFFHINHLIHSNMVLISMLIPANIALIEYYLEKPRLRNLILQSALLAYQILWGHPQIAILIACAMICYICIVAKTSWKSKFILATSIFTIAVGLTFHQLYPSARMYLQSKRAANDLMFSNYSLTPATSLSFIYPYMYSTWNHYYGLKISSTFTYVEFYNYSGIVALTLFVIFLLFSKRDKFY